MRSSYGIAFLVIFLAGLNAAAQSGMDIQKAGGAPVGAVPAGTVRETPLPLKRIALFSSGVAYFEHQGDVSSSARIDLPFKREAVNDALKSLVINDPHSPAPSVSYPSEETLYRTLKSLRVDLSGSPDMAELLRSLTGAEIEVYASTPITGRILGIEYRRAIPAGDEAALGVSPEVWLSLVTPQGIRSVGLGEISRFVFKDPEINRDLNRALDLILESGISDTLKLRVDLPGTSSRNITISYVIPAPVWKVSYRLDLSRDKPFLQGWAVVDNSGDIDWEGVELSLVAGRPVSFIQNLYPPYYVNRPVLPLEIAGAAEARTYDSGYGPSVDRERSTAKILRSAPQAEYGRGFNEEEAAALAPAAPVPAPNVAGGIMETARSSVAGDQFEFTLPHPVNLARQQSAMLPLVEGELQAEKVFVFSGAGAAGGGMIHPAVSAELTNTTGMRLPAGPVTVFDGGTYAGDALLNFFPEGEKRFISYGDDLTVNGRVNSSTSRLVSAVTVSRGVMTISRKLINEKEYVFQNNSREGKRLILEHPLIRNAVLAEPASYYERTDSLYRFALALDAGKELYFTVKEESPLAERIALAQLGLESLLSYASNEEIPPRVRAALTQGVELQRKTTEAKNALTALETRRTRLISEQDRIRRNLEAAGNQSTQGQEYLRRMAAMDGEIDTLNAAVVEAETILQEAQNNFTVFLGSIDL